MATNCDLVFLFCLVKRDLVQLPLQNEVKRIGKTLVAITNLPSRAMMGIESCGMLLSAVHNEEGEERLNLLMVYNKIPAVATVPL